MVTEFSFSEGFVISLITCVFLLSFILCMRVFDKKIRRRFVFILVALILALCADQLDSYLSLMPNPVFMRYICKLINVTVQGFIMLETVFIFLPKLSKEYRYYLTLPFLLVFAINCTAPFGQHVIYFTTDNVYKHGPFGALTYSQMVIYFAALVYIAVKKLKEGNRNTFIIIFLTLILNFTAAALEFTGNFGEPVLGTITVSIAFIYIFMYADRYNYDSITHCLKRRCFYSDCKKHLKNKMAIVSMDLNDLKYFNDNYGHFAGDDALRDFASTCKSCIDNKKYKLYRTGGDEFMILGIKASEKEVLELVDLIKYKLKNTQLTCSFGVAMYEPGGSLEEIVRKADREMYFDKEHYKKARKQQFVDATSELAANDQ